MRYIEYYPLTADNIPAHVPESDIEETVYMLNTERFIQAFAILERHKQRTMWHRYIPWFLKSTTGNRAIHELHMAWVFNAATNDWIRQEQVRRRTGIREEKSMYA